MGKEVVVLIYNGIFRRYKRIAFESVLMRWMNLEPITDSEVSHKVKVKVKVLSRIRLFAAPWTGAYQAPLSMGFSRQEYWSGLPLPSPGDLPDPGTEPRSSTLQADALPSEPAGKL